MDKLTILKIFTYSFSAIHMLLFLGTVTSSCLVWCSRQPHEGLGGLLHIYIPHIFGTLAYASFVIYWLWWYVTTKVAAYEKRLKAIMPNTPMIDWMTCLITDTNQLCDR